MFIAHLTSPAFSANAEDAQSDATVQPSTIAELFQDTVSPEKLSWCFEINHHQGLLSSMFVPVMKVQHGMTMA